MSSGNAEEQDNLFPGFHFGEPNKETFLGNSAVSVSDEAEDEIFSGNAEVKLELLPQPAIHVHLRNDKPVRMQSGPFFLLKLAKAKAPFKAFLVSEEISSEGASLVYCPRYEPVLGIGDETSEVSGVLFHLFNFKKIIGTSSSGEERDNAWHRIEHVDLKSADWAIQLRSVFETSANFKELENEGGYGLTHVAYLSKADRSLFTGEKAQEVLGLLRDFFSFAKGSRCHPVCSVGFDDDGNHVLEAWSSPKDSWSRPLSWFDEQHSEQLVALFPGFMEKCGDPDWRSALHEVIYWYLIANNTSIGIDAGIILAQTAIERLSFEYSVRDRRLVETKGFKELRASDRMRLLLSSLDIPLEIPAHLAELTKLAGGLNWLDSPHALTDVRNSLVHPERKQKASFSGCYYDTLRLGLWYLELAVLRICGYSEVYANRLTQKRVGEVERLPWHSRN